MRTILNINTFLIALVIVYLALFVGFIALGVWAFLLKDWVILSFVSIVCGVMLFLGLIVRKGYK